VAGNAQGASEVSAPKAKDRLGVLVCDRDGRIRTASREVSELLGGDISSGEQTVADRYAGSRQFVEWVTGALERSAAGESQYGLVRAVEGGMLRAGATQLEDGGFAVTLVRADVGDRVVSPQDVARKTWHDIQNQLGGLKLYATFLKRKLGDADPQIRETADKIVAGIDAVAQSIADARRGEGGK